MNLVILLSSVRVKLAVKQLQKFAREKLEFLRPLELWRARCLQVSDAFDNAQ